MLISNQPSPSRAAAIQAIVAFPFNGDSRVEGWIKPLSLPL